MTTSIARNSIATLSRPVLQKVEPGSPDWSSFIELIAAHQGDLKSKSFEQLALDHEAELLKRIQQSFFFLYRIPQAVIGGSDVKIEDSSLLIQRLFIKERFRNCGNGYQLLCDLESWSKGKGLKQIVATGTSSAEVKLWESFKAKKVEQAGQIVYKKII